MLGEASILGNELGEFGGHGELEVSKEVRNGEGTEGWSSGRASMACSSQAWERQRGPGACGIELVRRKHLRRVATGRGRR